MFNFPPEDAAMLVSAARNRSRMSQAALAHDSGISQAMISSIESGAKKPSRKLLDRVLVTAGMSPSVSLEAYRDKIKELAATANIESVRVFGSTANSTDTPSSDLDLVIYIDPDTDFGLFYVKSFADRVERLIGFPVDTLIDNRKNDPFVESALRDSIEL